MKRLSILTLLLCVMLMSAQAAFAGKTKTFTEPVCLATNTQVVTITKVEFTDTATIVSFHEKYKPGWWIRISKECYLIGEKGQKYMALKGEGITLDENYVTPESGEGDFKVLFEPMPKNTRLFDFAGGCAEKFFKIFGVHDKSTRIKVKVPKDDFRMTEELETEFFNIDTVRIKGRIEGYSRDLGFSRLQFLRDNAFTNESMPLTTEISEDGHFEISYIGWHPMNEMFLIRGNNLQVFAGVYVVPGQTTEIVLHLSGEVVYTKMPEGTFARDNSLRFDFLNLCDYESKNFEADKEACATVKDFTDMALGKMAKSLEVAEYVAWRFDYSPWEYHILRCGVKLSYAEPILYYINRKRDESRPGSGVTSLEEMTKLLEPFKDVAIYAFMREMPCDDPTSMMFSQTEPLLNKYEFSPIMWNFSAFDIDDLRSYVLQDTILTMHDKRIMGQQQPSLFGEIIMLRRYSNHIGNWMKWWKGEPEEIYNIWKPQFTRKSVLKHLELRHKKAVEQSNLVRPMPQTEAAMKFRKILNKYKGKYVMVDFWGIGCGPCRGSIQESLEMRKALRDHPDIEFVFINAAGESTPENYKKFVDEYLEGEEVYEVSRDDYNMFMELFNFLGIPHYETFDREGNIVNSNHSFRYSQDAGHFLEHYLNPLKEKLDK